MSRRLTIGEQDAVLADFAASNGLPAQSALDALDPLGFEPGWRRLLAYQAKTGQHTGPELLRMLGPGERLAIKGLPEQKQAFAAMAKAEGEAALVAA